MICRVAPKAIVYFKFFYGLLLHKNKKSGEPSSACPLSEAYHSLSSNKQNPTPTPMIYIVQPESVHGGYGIPSAHLDAYNHPGAFTPALLLTGFLECGSFR